MNTSDSDSFDVIVIGDGPGGDFIARRLGRAGKRVVIVEREALGGECLNWGCVPSKAQINFARQRPHLSWSDVRNCLNQTGARIHAVLTEAEARERSGAKVRVGEARAASLDWFRMAGEKRPGLLA